MADLSTKSPAEMQAGRGRNVLGLRQEVAGLSAKVCREQMLAAKVPSIESLPYGGQALEVLRTKASLVCPRQAVLVFAPCVAAEAKEDARRVATHGQETSLLGPRLLCNA